MDADDALAELAALVSFLRARIGGLEDGELSSETLATDAAALTASVDASRAAWDVEDHAVLASLWWQAYAYRVGGTTLACWLLNGTAPDPAIGGAAVGIARHRPSAVVYGPGAEPITDLDVLVDRLFSGHLDRIASALRGSYRLGEQLVWGNAGAGVASAMLALAGADGAPDVRDRIPGVLDALPHDIASLGHWRDGEHIRATCCLWYKTPTAKGGYCADCPFVARSA